MLQAMQGGGMGPMGFEADKAFAAEKQALDLVRLEALRPGGTCGGTCDRGLQGFSRGSGDLLPELHDTSG